MYIVQSINIWERVKDEKKQERQKCPAGTRQTDGKNWGLVWRNRKKISQIIKDYFHLPFFLLIILWLNHSGVFQIILVGTMSDKRNSQTGPAANTSNHGQVRDHGYAKGNASPDEYFFKGM
jgi:hypothetical protein